MKLAGKRFTKQELGCVRDGKITPLAMIIYDVVEELVEGKPAPVLIKDSELSQALNISAKTVARHISALVAEGFLVSKVERGQPRSLSLPETSPVRNVLPNGQICPTPRKKRKPKPAVKMWSFGAYVKMPEATAKRLANHYGVDRFRRLCEDVNNHCEKTDKPYKSYAGAINTFATNDDRRKAEANGWR